MKKLKFLALGLAGLMAFASCGKDDPVEGVDYTTVNKTGVFIGAGSNESAGSYVTKDGEVYFGSSREGAKSVADNGSTEILFVGNVDKETLEATICSGTVCGNSFVNGTDDKHGKASETKFAKIKKEKKANLEDVYNMTEFTETKVTVAADEFYAFNNETLNVKGWLEVKSIATADPKTNGITIDYYIIQKK